MIKAARRSNSRSREVAVVNAPTTKPDMKEIAAGAAAGVIGAQNRYDAGGTGRRMRGWTPPTAGPNRAILQIQKLRDRSRDASRNDWTAASTLQHWTTNLIGTGIIARFKRIKDAEKKKRYMDAMLMWIARSDSDCVLNFFGQQTLATRSWLESGEVFGRLRIMPVGSMEVPLKLQLLEADYIPMLDAMAWPGLPVNNIIRSGIELDPTGQRVAFWSYKSHPSDFLGLTITSAMLVRIPAEEMIHVFEPKRPGQLRGVPDVAPVLARLRNVSDFDDAVLERQKLANLFTAFVKQIIPANWDGTDPMTGKPIKYDKNGVPMAALEPGTTQELLAGEEVVFSNPPEAGTTYSEFMRGQNIGTSAGGGLPYELMSGDIANISDRTLRIVINEFRRYAEQRQWQIIIPMLCQRVLEKWVDIAAIAGIIDQEDIIDCKLAEWAPHGWEYIHPVQDVQGKDLAIQVGIRSRSSVIAERGDDPEEVDAERAEDMQRATKLGLIPAVPDPTTPVPPTPGQKQQQQARLDKLAAETALVRAQAAAADLTGKAAADRAQAYATAQQRVAETAVAEAAYHTARAAQAKADSELAQASVARITAEAAVVTADAEHRRALEEKKSKAAIKGYETRAADARREVDARIQAVEKAEAFAVQQRELMRQAETARTATAQLELQAAQVGLAELSED